MRVMGQNVSAVTEMREFLLTHTVGLTMMERCWLEQTHNLLVVMPRAPQDEEIQYDLSSYLPRIIHRLEALQHPSTSTISTDLIPLTSTIPHYPMTGSSTSSTSTAPLPPLHDLIRQILRLGLLPTPNSSSPYKLTMRCPLSAIPMGHSWSTTRSGAGVRILPPHLITPHPRTGQTLFWPGSYKTRGQALFTSLSPTLEESSTSPTTYRSP